MASACNVWNIKKEEIEIITEKGEYIDVDKIIKNVSYYKDVNYEETQVRYKGKKNRSK